MKRSRKGIRTDLFEACKTGDVEKVTNLLSSRRRNVNFVQVIKEDTGDTLLMCAAREGHDNVIDLLLSHGAKVNAIDDKGMTALMFACKGGHWKCVQSLLDSGSADIDQIESFCGISALQFVAMNLRSYRHLKCLKLLIEHGADLNIQTKTYKKTAIMFCISYKYHALESVKNLVEAGADTNLVDSENNSLLMKACSFFHTNTLTYLLANTDIDIHLKNSCGENALLIALKSWYHESYKAVEVLLEAGAKTDWDSLNIAAAKGFEKTRLILSYGSKATLSYMPNTNSQRNDYFLQSLGKVFSPLDIALFYQNFSTAYFLVSYFGCFQPSILKSDIETLSSNDINGVVWEMNKNLDSCPKFCERIRCLLSQPSSLKQMCAVLISQTTAPVQGRREKLSRAGLPTPLVNYIMLDFVKEHDYMYVIN